MPSGRLLSAAALLLLLVAASAHGQRITTIQLDGTQYFVSRMNPYSPELNYFLAYQYCRSLGLQLASFESREKADSLMQYLRNAGYNKFDYWTSGNRLGTDMLLWMSTGSPFNTTFDYMRRAPALGETGADPGAGAAAGADQPGPAPAAGPGRAGLQRARSRRPGRQSAEEVATGCVALRSPSLEWDTDDCLQLKDFICEQTRCYYYNYGSIPVSTAQGEKRARPTTLPTTTAPAPPPDDAPEAADNATEAAPQPEPADPAPATPSPTEPPPPPAAPAAGQPAVPDDSVNFASRSFPEKDADANVVYVTAVGVHSLGNGSALFGGGTAAPEASADGAPPRAEASTPAQPAAAAAAADEAPVPRFSRGRIDPLSLEAVFN